MKLDPWLFLIMINNLSEADTILYLDDTTLVKSVSKNETSYMQLRVDELVRQVEADGFQLSESKCKELRISFSRSESSVDHISINDKQIELVSKLLGVVVSDNLRRNICVESMCKKSCDAPELPKMAKAHESSIQWYATFLYNICLCPALECVCPVFHHTLPQYLSNEKEGLQKCMLSIILPDLFYAEALVVLHITKLYKGREALSNALFDQIVRDLIHKLHDLLPPCNGSTYYSFNYE